MDDYLSILIMILYSIQDAYICEILDDINLTWSLMINEIEQIMEIYNNLDNFSEQPNDISSHFNESMDYINNAIINP
jgi:hypothetical protein